MGAATLQPKTSQADCQITQPFTSIEPSRGLMSLKLGELWEYRELLYFFIWRDIKVRYKQTLMGAAWAVFQPLITMVVFTVVLGRLAKVPSDGLPYPIFTYTALLPWNYFARATNSSGTSLVSSGNLIKKIYFPRLIAPISAAVAPMVDFAIAFIVLLGMMAWYGIMPTWGILALPFFLLLALATALAISLYASALNVAYRDVGHAMPFLTQILMFMSPVFYPVSLVDEKWRLLYSLNPLAGVIEGFRWAMLGKESPDFGVMAVSTVVVLTMLFGGIVYFKRMERTFADVV